MLVTFNSDNVKLYFLICCSVLVSRTPVERTRPATTTRNVNQDLQTRDTAVCALMVSRAHIARKVSVKCTF